MWRKDPRIQSKGMAADGRPAVDRLSLAASAPERTAVLPLLRRRRTFIVLSGAEELRLSRRLAGLWPAGRRRRALAREAADGLLQVSCSEGAEREAAERVTCEQAANGPFASAAPLGVGGELLQSRVRCARKGSRAAVARGMQAQRQQAWKTGAQASATAEVAGLLACEQSILRAGQLKPSRWAQRLRGYVPPLCRAGNGGTPMGGIAHSSRGSRRSSGLEDIGQGGLWGQVAEHAGQGCWRDTPMKELRGTPPAEAMGAEPVDRPTVGAEGALKHPLELGCRACARQVEVSIDRLPHPWPVVREEVSPEAVCIELTSQRL